MIESTEKSKVQTAIAEQFPDFTLSEQVGSTQIQSTEVQIDDEKVPALLIHTADTWLLVLPTLDQVHTLEKKDFSTLLNEHRSLIGKAPTKEVIEKITRLMAKEVTPEQLTDAFITRGFAKRMSLEPYMYEEAIRDFNSALEIAQQESLPTKQLDALRSLIDAYRTSNRDPRFGDEKHPANLVQAMLLKEEAVKLMGALPTNEALLEKLNALIDFGLLALNTAQFAGRTDGAQNAMVYYQQARKIAETLIKEGHPQGGDRFNRLLHVEAAAIAQLSDEQFAANAEKTIAEEERMHKQFLAEGHQRGAGDTACMLGILYKRLGGEANSGKAIDWLNTALQIARNTEKFGVVDKDVEGPALKVLEEIKPQGE